MPRLPTKGPDGGLMYERATRSGIPAAVSSFAVLSQLPPRCLPPVVHEPCASKGLVAEQTLVQPQSCRMGHRPKGDKRQVEGFLASQGCDVDPGVATA